MDPPSSKRQKLGGCDQSIVQAKQKVFDDAKAKIVQGMLDLGFGDEAEALVTTKIAHMMNQEAEAVPQQLAELVQAQRELCAAEEECQQAIAAAAEQADASVQEAQLEEDGQAQEEEQDQQEETTQAADVSQQPVQMHRHAYLDFRQPLEEVCIAGAEFNSSFSSFYTDASAPSVPPVSIGSGADTHNNFTKGLKFSPDGSCLLTASEDNILRVFELPQQILVDNSMAEAANTGTQKDASSASKSSSSATQMVSVLQAREGETIYDYCWNTAMSSWDSTSCWFISTSRDHPIHMWDAFNGSHKASYRAFDHLDEITAAFSLAVNPQGTKIFAGSQGYERAVRVWDIDRAGRECVTFRTSATRKSREGQRGIVSCLAFNPTMQPRVFAAGSYGRTTCVYSEDDGELCLTMGGHAGGVTQVQFSPCGNFLFTGGRKDAEVLCWDIRATREVLMRYTRVCDTNQRVSFDLDATGRFLVTGSRDATARVYDTVSGRLVREIGRRSSASDSDSSSRNRIGASASSASSSSSSSASSSPSPDAGGGKGDESAHGGADETVGCTKGCTEADAGGGAGLTFSDAVNAAAFHPHCNLLAFSTGQRHFELHTDLSSDSDSGSGSGSGSDSDSDGARNGIPRNMIHIARTRYG